MKHKVWLVAFAIFASSCTGALRGGTFNPFEKPAVPIAVPEMLVPVFDSNGNLPVNTLGILNIWGKDGNIVGVNGPNGVTFSYIPMGVGSTVCFTADNSLKTCAEITTEPKSAAVIMKPVPPPIDPPLARSAEMLLPWTFEGRTCQTEQFGLLFMFDPFYISLNPADRQHWRDCHKRDGDKTMMVGFYAEYGEAGQPYGTGQLVPSTDLTGRWDLYRAIVKETREDHLQTILYMSGDNGLEYLQWAMPLAVKALRPQPNDPTDLADGQEFFLCFDSCVPGYQPPSRWNEAILFARSLLTQREIIAGELAAGYSSWCGGAENMVTMTKPGECGREDYNSAAGQQLDKIYLEYPLWSTVNDQYWQINSRLLGPIYRRGPTQPADDDPEAPFSQTSGKFYLGDGTPRGPFQVACMEKTQYGAVRSWYTQQDIDDSRAYSFLLGCSLVN